MNFDLKKNIQLCLLFLYFIIPKIDLINFSGFPTGIRLNDFLALILFTLNFKILQNFLHKLDTFYFLVFAGLIAYNIFSGNSYNAAFVSARIFEYFVIGFAFYKNRNQLYLLYAILSFNLLLAILQYINLIPVCDPIRGIHMSHTMNGSFGTPAEFSYFIIIIIFIISRYHRDKYSKFLFPIALHNSISASFIAAIYLFDYKKYLSLSLVPIYIYGVIFLSSSLGHVITFTYNTYNMITNNIERLDNYESLNKQSTFIKLTEKFIPSEDLKAIENEPISLKYRSAKWHLSIKRLYNSSPIDIFFGLGANKAGALDGGIVKFFCEYGLIGLIFFLYLTKGIKPRTAGIIVSINIAFDAFISSVISPLIILVYFHEKFKKP